MPSETLAPTTELEAVNDMLSVIGEAPVAQLDETEGDAQLALRLLRQESRAVQATGWHFNSDDNLKLLPNTDGQIVLPLGTLKVDTAGDSSGIDLTFREGKLYDPVNSTFTIAQTDGVFVDIVVQMPFESIPENARQYIKIRAGRKFLQRTIGSDDSLGYQGKDEVAALAAMEQEEESNAGRSIFDHPDYQALMYNRRPGRWV